MSIIYYLLFQIKIVYYSFKTWCNSLRLYWLYDPSRKSELLKIINNWLSNRIYHFFFNMFIEILQIKSLSLQNGKLYENFWNISTFKNNISEYIFYFSQNNGASSNFIQFLFFCIILFGEKFLTDRGTQKFKIFLLFQTIKHFQKYSQVKKWAYFSKIKVQ